MATGRYKDNNYFEKISVSSTSFSQSALASWNFTSTGIAIMVESSDQADIIEYSFDGTNVHGDMTPTMPSEAIIYDNRHQSKMWFRRASAGSSVVVRVEAWRSQS